MPRENQTPQPAQSLEVSWLQCADFPDSSPCTVLWSQGGQRPQFGRGDGCAGGGRAGPQPRPHLSDNLIAHCRGTATDAGCLDRDSEDEAGGVGIAVGGRPGVGSRERKGGGRAGQGARGGVNGQAAGKDTRQGIDQPLLKARGRPVIAAGGFWQHLLSDGGADGVDQVTHRGRAEARDAPGVGDGDGHPGGGGDSAVAADGMSDGGGGIEVVIVSDGHDGDGLNGVPGRGAKGQSGGAACQGGGKGRRHRDIAGGGVIQRDGVDGHAAFLHGEGRGADRDPGPVISGNGHGDGPAGGHVQRDRLPWHEVQHQREGLRRLRIGVIENHHRTRPSAARAAERPDPLIAERHEIGPGHGRLTIPAFSGDHQAEIGSLDGGVHIRGDNLDDIRQEVITLPGRIGLGGELHLDGIIILNGHHGGVGADRHVEVGTGRIRRQCEGKGLFILGNPVIGLSEVHDETVPPSLAGKRQGHTAECRETDRFAECRKIARFGGVGAPSDGAGHRDVRHACRERLARRRSRHHRADLERPCILALLETHSFKPDGHGPDPHGKGQAGFIAGRRVGVRIRDCVGQGDGRGDGGGRAGEGAVGEGSGQAGREAADQVIDQGTVAACGFRQRQGDDGVGSEGLVGDHRRAEGRHRVGGFVVGHGNRDLTGSGDGAIAGDRMGDGDGLVVGVRVIDGGDGDRLDHVPGGRAEGQGGGAACQFGRDGGCHRDIAGGGDVQHNGVGGRVVLNHDQGRGCDRDPVVTGGNGHDGIGSGDRHPTQGHPRHGAILQEEGLRRLRLGVVDNAHRARPAAVRVTERSDHHITLLSEIPGSPQARGRVTRPGKGAERQVEIGSLDGDALRRGDHLDGERQGTRLLADLVGRGGQLHHDVIVILDGNLGGSAARRHIEVGIGRIHRQRKGKGLFILGNHIIREGHVEAAGSRRAAERQSLTDGREIVHDSSGVGIPDCVGHTDLRHSGRERRALRRKRHHRTDLEHPCAFALQIATVLKPDGHGPGRHGEGQAGFVAG